MSGRSCSACADPRRPELDEALVSGESFRAIARRFAPLSRDAIRRHRPHVGGSLVKAVEARHDAEAETLLQKVERLEADARRLGARAEREGDLRAALVAVRELLDVVRLLHEMTPTPPTAGGVWLEGGVAEALRLAAERVRERKRLDELAESTREAEVREELKRELRAEVLAELARTDA